MAESIEPVELPLAAPPMTEPRTVATDAVTAPAVASAEPLGSPPDPHDPHT
jgi:hypothetical protein